MLAQERYNYILDQLQRKKTVHVKNLSATLDVTNETIRRDLEFLEKEGLLSRVHGGASSVQFETMQGGFNHRIFSNAQQKEDIAKKAISLVSEGQSISLDYSTTCLFSPREIKKYYKNLTIITNSNEIVCALSDIHTYNIIFCGGIYNFAERSCFGEPAMTMVRQLNIDLAFIGIGGVSAREGLTETFFDGVEMLRSYINAAQRKIVLADNSKFEKVALIKVCDLSDVDTIITDSMIKPKVLEKYKNVEIEIISSLSWDYLDNNNFPNKNPFVNCVIYHHLIS